MRNELNSGLFMSYLESVPRVAHLLGNGPFLGNKGKQANFRKLNNTLHLREQRES